MVERSTLPEDDEDAEDLAALRRPPAGPSSIASMVTLDSISPASTGKLWLTLSVPLVAFAFAGNHAPWALALVAALVGLNLAWNAPAARISRTITWPLFIIAILLLAGLLPLESLLPQWRTRLKTDFGINTPIFLSPQPWVTLENWLLFVMGLAWLLSCFSRGYGQLERRWLTRRLTLSITLLAIMSLLFEHFGIKASFWQHEWPATFSGPFSSPDIFGGFLAMGSLLAIAMADDASRLKRKLLLPYAVCLVPIFWALLVNSSRTGVLLFFGGLILWTGFSTFSKRSARRMSLLVALLLTLATLFIAFGETFLERFAIPKISVASLSTQARIKLAASSIDMISRAPLLGVGLANFEPAFALTAPSSDLYIRPVDPGSDWLWFAAEAGIPAVILLLLTVIAYIFKAGSSRGQVSAGRKHRRLRSACAAAALMIPIQGIFDVPGHQAGILVTAMLLAGLSLPRSKRDSLNPVSKTSALRVGAAILVFGSATVWLSISLGYPLLPGNSSAHILEQRAVDHDNKGELDQAYDSMSAAIAIKPLQWSYYYDRASLALPLGKAPGLIMEDFARARALEPHSGLLCYQEALLWTRYHPQFSVPAWQQALARDHTNATQFYISLCGFLEKKPELRALARELATDPRLKLAYLDCAAPEEFGPVLHELLGQQPNLNFFTAEERLKLFRLWYSHGDRASLLDALDHNPLWRAQGWAIIALGRAEAGDYKHACRIVMENLAPPIDGTTRRIGSLQQLQHAFLLHPTDYTYGLDLYEAEKAKNLLDDAMLTLEKVTQIPGSPRRLLYEQAVMLTRKDQHAKAWDKLRAYMEIREASDHATKEITKQNTLPPPLARSRHLQSIRL